MGSNRNDTIDLFGSESSSSEDSDRPLADRMRPRLLDELLGQDELLKPGGFLKGSLESDRLPSLILWGPPGCGKTSLAHVVAEQTSAAFEKFSAVLGGIKDVREIIARAARRKANGTRTILFVDEIHRFNKAQQDGFLPHVENGTVTLVGATTENPSFALNSALLSRCRVVQLKPLGPDATATLLRTALEDSERGLGSHSLRASEDALSSIAQAADGDARRALNLLEQAADYAAIKGLDEINEELLKALLEHAPLRYDRSGDAHYDLISAFIKSMRGSDPDAALYYAARMIESGEDPRFILRRVLIFASEDVANADPRALQVALAAQQAYERLGTPEGFIPMAQAITFCATAPKSNASYMAWNQAREAARQSGSLEVPLMLRNAPTKLMKELGHGQEYRNPQDSPGHFVKTAYLPAKLQGRVFYRPTSQGYEKHIKTRLAAWWGDDKPKV